MTKPVFLFLALLLVSSPFFSGPVLAQDRLPLGTPPPEPPPPALLVKEGERSRPLRVSSLRVEARIHGMLAETSLTITFHNPSSRALAGDLYFPLPQGSTVSGYALDIQGVMVDAVVVEKEKGRVVFEKIVRQGIDPGLVEWTKGNVFKTRVFPIPPRGSRTVRVRYQSDLVEAGGVFIYRLPLNFREKVARFSLRVEVIRPAAPPRVRGGSLANFSFKRWRESYVAETELRDAKLGNDLAIALPDVDRQPVLVERASDGETYFLITVRPPPHTPKPQPPRPIKRVAIYWDASGSREQSDHQRAFGLLREFFRRQGQGSIIVSLTALRDAPSPSKPITVRDGDASPLIRRLERIIYDGGTQLGVMPQPNPAASLAFLFSDGLSTFGKEQAPAFNVPLYAFATESTANHAYLGALARESGGEYFNLNRREDQAVLERIGRPAFSFLGGVASEGRITEGYPRSPQPAQGRTVFVGKLQGDSATVALRHAMTGGDQDKNGQMRHYRIAGKDAVAGDMVRLAWARKKLEHLAVSPQANEAEIKALGQTHGLVTPHTSLIVLDNVNLYVEHRIEPPASMPKWVTQYLQAVARLEGRKIRKRDNKLAYLLALWEERVNWWEKDFQYPPDFRYRKPVEKKSGSRNRRPSLLRDAAPRQESAEDDAGDSTGRQSNAGPPLGISRNLAEAPLEAEGFADRLEKKGKGFGGSAARPAPQVTIKPWDPKTPYLTALRKAKPGTEYTVYLAQRKKYGRSPAFYLDAGDFFLERNLTALALTVWSNIAELELENAALLRVLGHRLAQAGQLELARHTFQEILRIRPEEPQSHRDLGLLLGKMGRYKRAIELLHAVVMGDWDQRFPKLEGIVLMELNAMVPRARKAGVKALPLHPDLVRLLDTDLRIVLTWDTDMADMDLHVIEPSGEESFFEHKATTIGGRMSQDFTGGYGPEEYILKKAMRGTYRIEANYYGNSAPSLSGSVTLQVDLITNFGRQNEQRKSITVRLRQNKERLRVGEIVF